MLVPPTRSITIPARCSSSTTPTCASPRAPPPESTRPTALQASLRASRAMSAAGRSAPTRWWGPGPAARNAEPGPPTTTSRVSAWRKRAGPDVSACRERAGPDVSPAPSPSSAGLRGAVSRAASAAPRPASDARSETSCRAMSAAARPASAGRCRAASTTTRRRSAWRRQNRAHASSGCSATSSTSSCAASAASSRAGSVLGVGAVEPGQPGVAAQLGGEPVGEPTDERGWGAVERDEGEHGVGAARARALRCRGSARRGGGPARGPSRGRRAARRGRPGARRTAPRPGGRARSRCAARR